MLKYLKFSIGPLMLLTSIYIAYLGEGNYIWYFFLTFTTFIMLGDILLGSDITTEDYKYPFFLNLMLYLTLPLLIVLFAVSIYVIDGQSVVSFIGYCITVGFMLGSFGVNVGHELTHRKNKKLDMFIGNWIQALCLDNVFAIEHVYGHHKEVALLKDGASARRGEGIFSFMFRSTFNEYKNAFQIERTRLKIKGKSIFSVQNKFFRALLRSVIICVFIYSIASTKALVFYLISALISKILLETINYIEHYGLVRVEGRPVRPRHSWNSNTFVSSAFTFNLTRHSAHHEKAHIPYWKLYPYTDAPRMPYGYLSTFFFALLFPWLYRRMMAKKLLDWDKSYASESEKELISNLSL